ncbi:MULTISPECIES: hypothetical protein [unclassified Rathayibacter]|uniref:hypothetical protein n=1 Tax=unclassified Rathayibacter TaxID=2609250 RepID=UPI00188B5D75|nr:MULTISPECIES: hypothetical protein [unclassified Rathayibacter]MBF4461696.1 hypothetical protein [Rathayibacter sp. VKM Ac-2879]MBF4503107.1 hypothetical protein [Rathayibacter sp. VKM Ac-2878]
MAENDSSLGTPIEGDAASGETPDLMGSADASPEQARQGTTETGASDEVANSDDAGTTEPEATPEESDAGSEPRKPRKRVVRTYPSVSFLEALPIAEAVQKFAAGQRVRRLTLFEHLGRSPESGAGRQLVTNSNAYGLTTGSYTSEFLELTEKGKLASGDDSLGRARLAARLQLAIADIPPFNAIYEQFKNNRIPAANIIRDFVIEQSLATDQAAEECVETFLANARDLGLLTTYAGAERLLTFEILLEDPSDAATSDVLTPSEPSTGRGPTAEGSAVSEAAQPSRLLSPSPARIIADSSDLSNVCFLVTPIGEPDSEQRAHADLMLGSLIEPALTSLGLRIVRADRISTPGLITGQVIDHLVRSPLVIADLSFGNPNVFYELALRHAARKPIVQLIRKGDPLPFDVGQFRTVTIDMTSIYTLVPQLDVYRSEITRQCRQAIQEQADAETPLSRFYPNFWDRIGVSVS